MHIDKLVKKFGGSPEGQKCFISVHIEYVIYNDAPATFCLL